VKGCRDPSAPAIAPHVTPGRDVVPLWLALRLALNMGHNQKRRRGIARTSTREWLPQPSGSSPSRGHSHFAERGHSNFALTRSISASARSSTSTSLRSSAPSLLPAATNSMRGRSISGLRGSGRIRTQWPSTREAARSRTRAASLTKAANRGRASRTVRQSGSRRPGLPGSRTARAVTCTRLAASACGPQVPPGLPSCRCIQPRRGARSRSALPRSEACLFPCAFSTPRRRR